MAAAVHRRDRRRLLHGFSGSRWCVWGSWDGLGRGFVQICCKGAPRPDRPREEARNINDPPPASRLDRGLCNRFGQPAPPWAPGGVVMGRTATTTGAPTTARSAGRRPGPRGRAPAPPARRGSPVDAPRRARSSLDPRDRRVTHEYVCQRYVLAGQVTISAVTRRSRGPRRRSGTRAPYLPTPRTTRRRLGSLNREAARQCRLRPGPPNPNDWRRRSIRLTG